jgi:hypothetical protein
MFHALWVGKNQVGLLGGVKLEFFKNYFLLRVQIACSPPNKAFFWLPKGLE